MKANSLWTKVWTTTCCVAVLLSSGCAGNKNSGESQTQQESEKSIADRGASTNRPSGNQNRKIVMPPMPGHRNPGNRNPGNQNPPSTPPSFTTPKISDTPKSNQGIATKTIATKTIRLSDGKVTIDVPANSKTKSLGNMQIIDDPMWKNVKLQYSVTTLQGGMKSYMLMANNNKQNALIKIDEHFTRLEPKLGQMQLLSKKRFDYDGYPAMEYRVRIVYGGRHRDTYQIHRHYVHEEISALVYVSAKSLEAIDSQSATNVLNSVKFNKDN